MSVSRTLRVLALQPALKWLKPMPNFMLVRQMLETHLAASPADLVVLPEVFNGIGSEDDPAAPDQARLFLSRLAGGLGVAIIGGSIDLIDPAGNRRNRCFVVDESGREIGCYDKQVMFALEQDTRIPGRSLGCFELRGWRVGVAICADVWDPVLMREYAGKVDLLCVPAKTTVPTEAYTDYARRLWWGLALTRAMENGLAVVVSDWAHGRQEGLRQGDDSGRAPRGPDPLKQRTRRAQAPETPEDTGYTTGQLRTTGIHYTSGASAIIDPGRRPEIDRIQLTLPQGGQGLLSAAIDLDALERYREHRRSVGLLPEAFQG